MTNIKLYKQEKEDGFSSLTNVANASCQLARLDKPSDIHIGKAKAAVGDGKDFDLYYLASILASAGYNSNDDTFLPEELWEARATPIHKQFNFNHNETDIIGVMFDSFLLDAEGNRIEDEKDIPLIKDIATHSVIWTKWEDPVLQGRMNKIIAEIEDGIQFVSMEVLFRDFDYLLTTEAETKVVARNDATAFLTKHLKAFGGDGVWKDFAVKRVLRNFTFSGKGLTPNPANS